VKHVASVADGYFGEVFGRPSPDPAPWDDEGAEPNGDMWATPDESRADVVGYHHRVWACVDATIEALDLDTEGHVPWWSEERSHPTLHTILVHMIAETNRHAGHADIVRETIDGAAGLRPGTRTSRNRTRRGGPTTTIESKPPPDSQLIGTSRPDASSQEIIRPLSGSARRRIPHTARPRVRLGYCAPLRNSTTENVRRRIFRSWSNDQLST
jgi:Protein of unknown function (DUF664)